MQENAFFTTFQNIVEVQEKTNETFSGKTLHIVIKL